MLFYFYSFETLSLSHVCSQVYYEVFPFDIDAVFQTMLVDTARIRLNRFQVEKKKDRKWNDSCMILLEFHFKMIVQLNYFEFIVDVVVFKQAAEQGCRPILLNI